MKGNIATLMSPDFRFYGVENGLMAQGSQLEKKQNNCLATFHVMVTLLNIKPLKVCRQCSVIKFTIFLQSILVECTMVSKIANM